MTDKTNKLVRANSIFRLYAGTCLFCFQQKKRLAKEAVWYEKHAAEMLSKAEQKKVERKRWIEMLEDYKHLAGLALREKMRLKKEVLG